MLIEIKAMMEEDSWVCVDEIFSDDENFSDSDKIDSETEAELYSLIHFEGNLSSVSHQSSAIKNVTKPDATVPLPEKMKYVLSTEKKECNGETEFVGSSNNFLQNYINEVVEIKNCDKNLSDISILKTFQENEEIFHTDHEVPPSFLNNSNSNQLVKTQSSNNGNKRKFDSNTPNNSSPPKKAATDSGRKINWVDSSGNKDIQTNVCEDEDDDIIFISSDSETDHSSPSKKRIPLHQNMSMPNIKIGENTKDLWFVNQEDINSARCIKSRRYHDKVDVTCSNCNRKGHHYRICPLPKSIKCFICGGDHMGTACMNRICGKCYGTGHDRRSCYMSVDGHFCKLCNMQGHTEQNCPDLWRRYHLTTKPGKIIPDKKIKRTSFVFCCKCGRQGHFGAVCNFPHKGYKNCFSTWPNVLSYDEPYSLQVKPSNTTGNEQKIVKKDLVTCRKKKNPNEAQKLARKAKLKKKMLKQLQIQNTKSHQVVKEKDFPRSPKNNSAINLSSPRTPKNNSAINLSNSKTPKNNSAINLSSPKPQNKNIASNLFNPRTSEDDSVVILPTPKTKKKISVIDLTSPKTPKNNSVVDLITFKTLKNSRAFDEFNDVPESVRQLMLAQARRRERNRLRRIRRRQNRARERKQMKKEST